MAGNSNRDVLLWLASLALAAGFGVYACWTYGLPWLAAKAASWVPVEFERQMGEAMAAALPRTNKPCLEEVSAQLQRALPAETPYRFQIRCADSPEVNAFAAPGGLIVVFDGLLDRVRSTDLEAAIVAHEMQHVLHRHSIRAIFRAFAVQAVFALALGDVSSLAAQLAGGVTSLHYQRADEDEADRHTVQLLHKAGFDAEAMPAMLETLEKATRDNPQLPEWISSHPDIKERIAATRVLARSLK